ncbi:MAG: NAD(P)H-dependent oxidoreductase [Croceibacterium sp.]
MNGPLKHAIIACHPSADSFTLAIANRYAEAVRQHGHEVIVRDLYLLGFDPVLKLEERDGEPAADIVAEWDALGEIDVFVLAYPIWFGAPPAMLKGYIDRVFGAGRHRGTASGEAPSSVLQGKNLVSLTLSGSMRSWLDEKGVLGSLRNLFDRYLGEVFGLPETHHYHFDGVQPGLPERDYRFHLAEVDNAATEVLARIGRGWSKNPNAGEPPLGG